MAGNIRQAPGREREDLGLLAAPVYRRTLAARSHSSLVVARMAQPDGS
jgi:hypothetical protein